MPILFLFYMMQSFFAGKMAVERAEGFQRAIGKPFGRLRRGETLRKTGRNEEGSFLCLPQEIFFLAPSHCRKRAPKVSKGRSESPLVASAEAKPSVLRKRKEGIFPLSFIRNSFFMSLVRYKRWAPKGSRGRAESPLVASAEAKPSAKQKVTKASFPCLPQEICFL